MIKGSFVIINICPKRTKSTVKEEVGGFCTVFFIHKFTLNIPHIRYSLLAIVDKN